VRGEFPVRPAALLLALLLSAGLAGCINPEYLAQAKDRYEVRHHLKKETDAARSGAGATADQKKSHPPFRDRECQKCHNQQKGSELLAKGADLCYLCHDRTHFKRERLHGPVAVGKCSDCHVSHENGYPYHTTSALPKLCLTCHTFAWGGREGLKEGFFLHKPVAEGACPRCHDPHGGTRRYFLLAEPVELCLRCHNPQAYGAGVVHGPLAVGDCLACHDPHAAQAGRLLKTAFTAELCFRCHTQPRVKCAAPPERKDCLTCHHPHQLTQQGRQAAGAVK
jgi:predicted CXXCH cytochrome family protein